MKDPHSVDCLSFGDALFLHLERAEAPLHVASLCILEGKIAFETFAAYIESKLPLIPRCRQYVVPPPFGLGVPVWEYDPHFEILNHVNEIKLKRGTAGELKNVVSHILSTMLDRQRPLWKFTLISGLQGNQTAALLRVHHCLADGISGVGLMNVLLEPNAVPAPLPKKKVYFEVPPPRNQATQLLDGFVTTCFTAVERMLAANSGFLTLAQQLASANGGVSPFNGTSVAPNLANSSPANGLNSLLPEFASPTERLPFNTLCRGPQKFRWTEIPFSKIRAIKKAHGTSVNDVFLALMTMAVRHYVEAKHVSTHKRILRIVVPVNVRSEDDTAKLGNQITFLPVTVPLGIRDPQKLLQAIHERIGALRTIRLAEIVGLAGTLLGTIPTAAQAVIAPLLSQWQVSLCNLICTNIPGPKTELYLHGHKLVACYPYVPIGGEMGMNCAVMTYNDTAFFGFTGDSKAIPDLDRLPKFLEESFEELLKTLPVQAPKRQVRRKKAEAVHDESRLTSTEVEVSEKPPELFAAKQEPKAATVDMKTMAMAASD